MKTAVEWLFNELYSIRKTIPFEQQADAILKAFEQAKAMEKKQMIEAVDFSLSSIELSEDKNSWTALTAEQYYNERFILKTI